MMRKKLPRRLLTLLLALLLLSPILPVQALADTALLYTVGDTAYRVQTGTVPMSVQNSGNSSVNAEYFYSDGYFAGDPTVYDAHLSTMSLLLAQSACHAKNTACVSFLGTLGFRDISGNDVAASGTNAGDSIGYTIASRSLTTADGTATGKTLIAVVIRGDTYGKEWVSNFLLGSSGESSGFAAAAGKVVTGIDQYLSSNGYGSTDNPDLLYWIVGFSRGGAVANLTGKRLITSLSGKGVQNTVFCYTSGAGRGALNDNNAYPAIHNVVSDYDLFTWLAPKYNYNFIRYGSDHDVTKIALTANWWTQLNAIDPKNAYPASFHGAYLTVNLNDMSDLVDRAVNGNLTLESSIQPISSTVTIPTYLKDLTSNLTKDASNKWVGSRANYTSETFSYTDNFPGSDSTTLETAICNTLGIALALNANQKTLLKGFANALSDNLKNYCTTGGIAAIASHLLEVVSHAEHIRDWNSTSTKNKKSAMLFLWNRIEATTYTTGGKTYTLSSILGSSDYALIKKSFPVLVNAAFRMAMYDYSKQYPAGSSVSSDPMYIFATLIYNVSSGTTNPSYGDKKSLFAAGTPAAYLAALRTEDSFYASYNISVNGALQHAATGLVDCLLFATYDPSGQMISAEYTPGSALSSNSNLVVTCPAGRNWSLFYLSRSSTPQYASGHNP